MIGTSSESRLVLLVVLVDASHGSIRKPGHSSSQIRLIGSGRRHDISLGLDTGTALYCHLLSNPSGLIQCHSHSTHSHRTPSPTVVPLVSTIFAPFWPSSGPFRRSLLCFPRCHLTRYPFLSVHSAFS